MPFCFIYFLSSFDGAAPLSSAAGDVAPAAAGGAAPAFFFVIKIGASLSHPSFELAPLTLPLLIFD